MAKSVDDKVKFSMSTKNKEITVKILNLRITMGNNDFITGKAIFAAAFLHQISFQK